MEADERRWRARSYACDGRWQDFVDLYGFPKGLNEGQIAIAEGWQSGVRRLVARIGRRGGKTMIAALMAAYETLRRDRHGWVVAPTHDLSGRVWNYYRSILCADGPVHPTIPEVRGLGLNPVRETKGPRRLEFPWGSWAEGKTISGKGAESLVGEPLHWIVWDECAQSPDVWGDHLMPNLSDLAGWCLFVGKPWGHNHFEEKYELGRSAQEPDWAAYHFTSEVNFKQQPNLRQDFAEAKRQWSDELFQQEWMAEFTTFAGQVYKEFALNQDRLVVPLPYDPNLPLYMAFDWGVENPFVCLWAQVTSGDVVRVINEYYSLDRMGNSLRLTPEQNFDAVLAKHRVCGYPMAPGGGPDIEWAVGDRSEPGTILTANHKGIPCRPAIPQIAHRVAGIASRREIPGMIELLRRFFREYRILVDADNTPNLQRELNLYAYPEKKEEREADEVPKPINDHGPDALRYLVGNKYGALQREFADPDADEANQRPQTISERWADKMPQRYARHALPTRYG